MLLKRKHGSYLVVLLLSVLTVIFTGHLEKQDGSQRGRNNMAFDNDLVNTLRYEGGLTNDTGGLTNYGIRQDIYNAYTKVNKLPNKSVKELKYGDVRNFYESEYYKKPKINMLPEDVQGIVFDTAVNLGQGTAIKQLQRLVGSKPDGLVGKNTIAQINKYVEQNGSEELKRQLLNTRMDYYRKLSESNPGKYGKYIDGWYNRVIDLARKHGIND